jgi:hypothetical protein
MECRRKAAAGEDVWRVSNKYGQSGSYIKATDVEVGYSLFQTILNDISDGFS